MLFAALEDDGFQLPAAGGGNRWISGEGWWRNRQKQRE